MLGVALAVLGARLFRLGWKGFVGLLASAAARRALDRLARALRNRARTTCAARSRTGAGLLSSLASRVPLSYLPALHAWQLVVPLLFVLAAAFALAWRARGSRRRGTSCSPSASRSSPRCSSTTPPRTSSPAGSPSSARSPVRSAPAPVADPSSCPRSPSPRAGEARAGARAGVERVAAGLVANRSPRNRQRPRYRPPRADLRVPLPEGPHFERFQSMTAPAPEKCDVCGASPVEIVLYPVAIHYKGSGFYSTDYGKGKAAKKDGGESAARRRRREHVGGRRRRSSDSKPAETKAGRASGDSSATCRSCRLADAQPGAVGARARRRRLRRRVAEHHRR